MIYILVEGKEDIHFIEYLLSIKLEMDENLYKVEWNGSHGISKAKLLHLEEYAKEYTKIIIIDDADKEPTKRKKEIEKKLESKNIKGEIFLFPNNKDEGELEDLLCHCIPDKKLFVSECFEKFQDCLVEKNKTKEFINTPAIKSKVYTYVDVQLNKDEQELRNNPKNCKCIDKKECICKNKYCFSKQGLWNFDSEDIQPLLEFLDKNVK